MTQVCATVTADRLADLRARRDAASGADLVELRLDGVADVDVAGALEGRTRPAIVTCRPAWEGGRFDGSEEDRLRLLAEAVRLGAEFVDVEWRADRRAIRPGERTRLVLSHHDFDSVPADLADRVRAMRREGAAIVKVAVMAGRLADCLTLREAVEDAGDVVAVAMGPAGALTRCWPAWVGSRWTYGGAAAPGQVPVAELVGRYRVRETSRATALYAVAGAPLGHSASPAMHNAAFAHLGLDAVYLPLETADAHDFEAVAVATGLRGASITAPLKRAVVEALAPRTDEAAAAIGAVNTLRAVRGGWEARNFDVAGFLTPLDRRDLRLRGRRAVVLGAGGAAQAAAWALVQAGARVEVAARRPEAARTLAAQVGARAVPLPPEPGWDLLINATPVGTAPAVDATPLAADRLAGGLVYDLVYNPAETRLMREARAAGVDVIGGLDMLVAQACRQVAWWTGRAVPRAVVESAARAFVTEEA